MPVATLYRAAGIAGLAAGVLNVLAALLPPRVGLPLDLVGNIFGLWSLAALYLRQREPSGILGAAGYALESFGLALLIGLLFAQAFVVIELEAAQAAALLAGSMGLAAVAGLALVILGALLFGIASLRAGVLPRWGSILLMVGFIALPAAAAVPAVQVPADAILSAGLIWLSLWLMQDARAAPKLSTN